MGIIVMASLALGYFSLKLRQQAYTGPAILTKEVLLDRS